MTLCYLADHKKSAGYATVCRHVNFFVEMEWLIVVNKVKKGYLLKKECTFDEEPDNNGSIS